MTLRTEHAYHGAEQIVGRLIGTLGAIGTARLGGVDVATDRFRSTLDNLVTSREFAPTNLAVPEPGLIATVHPTPDSAVRGRA